MIIFKSDRLEIREFESRDRAKHYDLKNSPEYQRYNCEKYELFTKDELEKDFAHLLSAGNSIDSARYILAVQLKKAGGYIGFIGFKTGPMSENGSIELFYALLKEYWNQGYGTELLNATINFGFKEMKLHRIYAGCDEDNIASERIMQKTGMTKESNWREDRLREGIWKNGCGYAILENDFSRQLV